MKRYSAKTTLVEKSFYIKYSVAVAVFAAGWGPGVGLRYGADRYGCLLAAAELPVVAAALAGMTVTVLPRPGPSRRLNSVLRLVCRIWHHLGSHTVAPPIQKQAPAIDTLASHMHPGPGRAGRLTGSLPPASESEPRLVTVGSGY